MSAIFYGASVSVVPGPVATVSDTVLHTVGYSGLALVTLRALARGRWSNVTRGALVVAWLIAVLHGGAVEWMQMYVPGRTAEWRDLGNDAVGAVVGLGAAWAWGIMSRASLAD